MPDEMDKQEVVENLRAIAADASEAQCAYLRRVAKWLEAKGTTEEVREALARLAHRLGAHASDLALEITAYPAMDAVTNGGYRRPLDVSLPTFVQKLDAIYPEPISGAPDPSEIGPGTTARTKGGYLAYLYPYHQAYSGVWRFNGDWYASFWDSGGKCIDSHLAHHVPVHIDWAATRAEWLKERGNG